MNTKNVVDALFPRDTTHGPVPGTPEYDEFIDDQLTIVNADYVRSVSKLSPVADEIFEELGSAARGLITTVMPGRPLRVLDICCGVGLAVESLLKHDIPVQSVTFTEQDSRLLERALDYFERKGLRERLGKVSTAVFDPNIHALADLAPGEYDFVVSCNAFQHFSCGHQKELIRQIYEQLSAHGIFMMQSHLKVLEPDWRNSIIEHMKGQMSAMNADPAFVARAIRHTTRFHNFVPTTDLYGWCNDAGFSLVETVFRRHIITIVAAVK